MGSNATEVGAGPPPPGVTPDFHHGESIGYQLILVAVLLPVLTIAVWALRLYTARCIVKRWHWDDFFITLALAFAMANSIIQLVQLQNGVGHHLWDVPLTHYKRFMKLGAIGGSLTYNFATMFIKVSILSFYLRFPSGLAFQGATYFTMLVAVGYSLPQAIAWSYLCKPAARYWDFTIDGECGDVNSPWVASASLNVATDVIILLLPIWLLIPIWLSASRRMPYTQKIGLTVILMAGGFVCAVSIVRLHSVVAVLYNPDITRHYIINLIWCLVEMYMGIICACLPTLRGFFRQYYNSFLEKIRNPPPDQNSVMSMFTIIRSSARRRTGAPESSANGEHGNSQAPPLDHFTTPSKSTGGDDSSRAGSI